MGKKKEERAHALLSASSARKWLYCTPSARLEDTLPDTESEYAKEGTLAHSICELKLSKLFTDKNMTERTYKSRLKKLQGEELYQPEMEVFTDEYVDYISQIAFGFSGTPFIAVEKKLDYSPWAPEGFGTGDCIIIYGKDLHIVDFKYGKGKPVSAEGNPQMGLYGLGAYHEYGLLFAIENVHFHIVQPRVPNNNSWSTTLKELLDWGEWVKTRAEMAFHGEGEFRPADYCNADSVNYCREGFCKAYGRCRATADKNMALYQEAWNKETDEKKLPPLITWEEVGKLLKKARFLKSWVENLEKISLERIVSGGELPGWKIIEGRSNREVREADTAFAELVQAGYEEAILYHKKPIPLGELEKVVSKEDREAILAKYIVKPQGAPKLVPEDDKRPAMIINRITPEEAFGGTNQYKEEK